MLDDFGRHKRRLRSRNGDVYEVNNFILNNFKAALTRAKVDNIKTGSDLLLVRIRLAFTRNIADPIQFWSAIRPTS